MSINELIVQWSRSLIFERQERTRRIVIRSIQIASADYLILYIHQARLYDKLWTSLRNIF